MTYTIKKGDTLSKIAKQHNTTVDELLKLNPYITDPNKIYAGKTLNLPTSTPQTPAPQTPAPQTPAPQAPIVSNPYDAILKDLEEAYRRQREAHEASTDALLSELEAGKQTIAQQAYDSTRAASANYAQAQRVLPEQMARLGLYGTGASETSLVNLGNVYRNVLGDINLAKTQGLQNIDTQKRNIQAQAQQIISSAYSDYINSRANILLQAQKERMTREGWAQQERMAQQEMEWRERMAQQERAWQRAAANPKGGNNKDVFNKILKDIETGYISDYNTLIAAAGYWGLNNTQVTMLKNKLHDILAEQGIPISPIVTGERINVSPASPSREGYVNIGGREVPIEVYLKNYWG